MVFVLGLPMPAQSAPAAEPPPSGRPVSKAETVTAPAVEFESQALEGGTEEELDSMAAQADAASRNDGEAPGVSRRVSSQIE